MAEIDIKEIVSSVKSIEEAYDKLKSKLSEGLNIKDASSALESLAKKFNTPKEALEGFKKGLSEASESISRFVEHTKNVA